MLIESNEETRFLRKSQINLNAFFDFLYDYHRFHFKILVDFFERKFLT